MISLRDVHLGFSSPLLRGVELSLSDGQIWGLVGPAACGKSVLLKLICGLFRPDSGRIEVDGAEVSSLSEAELLSVRSRIGMLFQNNALFDFLDVIHNVAFPLVRRGVSEDEALERAAVRLRQVGLSGSERKAPGELSGGMRKRVGIARASIAGPTIAIYDEPTAGLDPVTTSKIYDLLRADHEQIGATTIIVSSDVDALRRFAPSMGLLHHGKLCYDGPSDGMEDAPDPVVRQFVVGETEGPL